METPIKQIEPETIDLPYAEEIQDKIQSNADKKAQKILRKNKREIRRLKLHAEKAVYANNYVAYAYAIKKLRGYYKQPYTEELIKLMWKTTRDTVYNIVTGK